MKVLHLKLRKGRNLIKPIQQPIQIQNSETLKIQYCIVAWSLKNVNTHNNTLTMSNSSGDTLVKIPEGYYSFDQLNTFLKTYNITLTYQRNNRVVIFCSTHSLTLTSFGTQLGFEPGEKITLNTRVVSQYPAKMTNGLKEIYLHCDLVNTSDTFSHYLDHYYPSHLLAILPIDTSQSLNGTFSRIPLENVRLPCYNIQRQEFYIDVVSGGEKEDYEILLGLEISV